MAIFNTTVRQMTEMFQWEKNRSDNANDYRKKKHVGNRSNDRQM